MSSDRAQRMRIAARLVALALACSPLACSNGDSVRPERTHVVSGTARRGGAPVSGADVWLVRNRSGEMSELWREETDASGAFRFASVGEGIVVVSVNSGDSLAAAVRTTLDTESPNEVVLAPLALERAGVFVGRVLSGGAPAPNLVVSPDDLAPFDRTDSTGTYHLTPIPLGTWAVRVVTLTTGGIVQGTLTTPGDTVTLPDLLLDTPTP